MRSNARFILILSLFLATIVSGCASQSPSKLISVPVTGSWATYEGDGGIYLKMEILGTANITDTYGNRVEVLQIKQTWRPSGENRSSEEIVESIDLRDGTIVRYDDPCLENDGRCAPNSASSDFLLDGLPGALNMGPRWKAKLAVDEASPPAKHKVGAVRISKPTTSIQPQEIEGCYTHEYESFDGDLLTISDRIGAARATIMRTPFVLCEGAVFPKKFTFDQPVTSIYSSGSHPIFRMIDDHIPEGGAPIPWRAHISDANPVFVGSESAIELIPTDERPFVRFSSREADEEARMASESFREWWADADSPQLVYANYMTGGGADSPLIGISAETTIWQLVYSGLSGRYDITVERTESTKNMLDEDPEVTYRVVEERERSQPVEIDKDALENLTTGPRDAIKFTCRLFGKEVRSLQYGAFSHPAGWATFVFPDSYESGSTAVQPLWTTVEAKTGRVEFIQHEFDFTGTFDERLEDAFSNDRNEEDLAEDCPRAKD